MPVNGTEPFAPVDAAWLRMEDPTNLMMITGVLIFDQPLDLGRITEVIEQRLLRFDRFHKRAVVPKGGGTPYWENDPNFNLRSHIHRIALPAPGDQSALQELVSDLMSMPLDFSKPLWQWHLVEHVGDGCALIVRLHHSIADGVALVRVLLSLTDPSPDAAWNPPELIERPARNLLQTALGTGRQISEMFQNSDTIWKLARNGASSVEALGKLLLMPPDPQTLFKGSLGVQKQAAWSMPLPLQEIKAIGKITGGTVNDILLTAVTGALRHYMLSRGDVPDGLSIRAAIPVNLRPAEDPLTLGNRFGVVFLSLPVGIEDPLDRLLAVKERMEAIKGSPEAIVAFGILTTMGISPMEIQNIGVNMFGSKATGVMTNVPGPPETVYMAGKPIRTIMFWVPQSAHLGLGVSILSYAGQVTIGIATDAGLVPDPQAITAAFHDEIDELVDLIRLMRT